MTPYDGARLRGVVMATMLGGEIVFDHGECIGPPAGRADLATMTFMSAITTHVLDTARGRPAAGIGVALERRADDGRWDHVGRGHTDNDGRLRTLYPANEPLRPGVYRLTFDTQKYFDAAGRRRRSIRKSSSCSRQRPAKRTITCRCCSARSASRTYRGT